MYRTAQTETEVRREGIVDVACNQNSELGYRKFKLPTYNQTRPSRPAAQPPPTRHSERSVISLRSTKARKNEEEYEAQCLRKRTRILPPESGLLRSGAKFLASFRMSALERTNQHN